MTTLMTLEPIGATPVDVANYGRRWWILAVLGIAQLMVILTPTTVQAALLHSYTTAFLWSALIFVIGADRDHGRPGISPVTSSSRPPGTDRRSLGFIRVMQVVVAFEIRRQPKRSSR